jgi:hypothetical protein
VGVIPGFFGLVGSVVGVILYVVVPCFPSCLMVGVFTLFLGLLGVGFVGILSPKTLYNFKLTLMYFINCKKKSRS